MTGHVFYVAVVHGVFDCDLLDFSRVVFSIFKYDSTTRHLAAQQLVPIGTTEGVRVKLPGRAAHTLSDGRAPTGSYRPDR